MPRVVNYTLQASAGTVVRRPSAGACGKHALKLLTSKPGNPNAVGGPDLEAWR